MRRFSTHAIAVDQGQKILFSDFEDGGPMWSDTGQRESRHRIEFSRPFQSSPLVKVGLSMWDMDSKTNQRADIVAENIGRRGFDLVFRTWGDTRVARVRADWIALGEADSAEEWELY